MLSLKAKTEVTPNWHSQGTRIWWLPLVVLASWTAAVAVAERPNIVLILADDMGFSDIGCYGGEIETPHLDALAAGGLRYTQFYNTARCCPTRASLLTGLHPHQAGMGHMTSPARDDEGRVLPGYQGGLNNRCVTIAEVLRQSGYRTYMAGKWHVTRHTGPEGPKQNWPLQRGFDKFYGTIIGAGSFYDPATLCRQNEFITPRNDPLYTPKTFYYTDAITDNAIQFVKQHYREAPGEPFFLYLSYTAAHWPMHALPEDIAKYRGRYDDGYAPIRARRYERLKTSGIINADCGLSRQAGDWSSQPHQAWEARCMEVYAAMIDCMDQGIGRLVHTLRERDELADTLIIYLQDNGACAEGLGRQEPGGSSNKNSWADAGGEPMKPDELQRRIRPPMKARDGRPLRGGPTTMPGPDGTYVAYGRDWANVSNTPFREYKHWVHEGGISTPLIAHWPRGIPHAGELRHQPGQLMDIMATCVEVSGAKYPGQREGVEVTSLEGVSLLPTFINQSSAREAMYWEHEANCAVRAGRWKLVRKAFDWSQDGWPWELYDLESDRAEMHNLADEQPERVEELAARWESWAERAHVKPWARKQN